MTIAGVILLIIGLVVFGLIFTDNVPEPMTELLGALGFPLWAWLAIAGVGAILIYFNRRPAN